MIAEGPTSAALAVLEGAFNRYLALDPVSLQAMAAFHGRTIGIEVRGVGLRFYILPGRGGVQLLGHFEGEPDARLRATPAGFARLGLGGEAADAMFAGDVQIEGDTELGQGFKAVLDGMQVDWEEQLSRVTGDVLAHQLMRGVHSARAWGRHVASSLERDTGEYLQEEARVLPAPLEVVEFLDGVDQLRGDGDRLEARIQRLEHTLRAGEHQRGPSP